MLSWRFRSLIVVLIVAAIDFAARITLGFDMRRVAIAEAILFSVTGALIYSFARVASPHRKRTRRLEVTVAAMFGLAAVRAAAWAMGAPVLVANLMTLGLAAILGLALVIGWYRARRQRMTAPL